MKSEPFPRNMGTNIYQLGHCHKQSGPIAVPLGSMLDGVIRSVQVASTNLGCTKPLSYSVVLYGLTQFNE